MGRRLEWPPVKWINWAPNYHYPDPILGPIFCCFSLLYLLVVAVVQNEIRVTESCALDKGASHLVRKEFPGTCLPCLLWGHHVNFLHQCIRVHFCPSLPVDCEAADTSRVWKKGFFLYKNNQEKLSQVHRKLSVQTLGNSPTTWLSLAFSREWVSSTTQWLGLSASISVVSLSEPSSLPTFKFDLFKQISLWVFHSRTRLLNYTIKNR